VKDGSGGGRFLAFTFGTSPRKGRFPGTEIGISAFSAFKTLSPFQGCDKLHAFLVALKKHSELLFGKIICKEIFHATKIVIIKRFK
jgi:hypothetical protein